MPNRRDSIPLIAFGDFHITIFIPLTSLSSLQKADAAEYEEGRGQQNQKTIREDRDEYDGDPQRKGAKPNQLPCFTAHTAPPLLSLGSFHYIIHTAQR